MNWDEKAGAASCSTPARFWLVVTQPENLSPRLPSVHAPKPLRGNFNVRINFVQTLLNLSNRLGDLMNDPLDPIVASWNIRIVPVELRNALYELVRNRSLHNLTPSQTVFKYYSCPPTRRQKA